MSSSRPMPTLQSPGNPIVAEIRQLGPWFHNLHLCDGTQTAPDHPLGDFPRVAWDLLDPHLPDTFEGRSVLDVGCNAGFYTFELARRGARVVGVEPDPHYLAQARWARERLHLQEEVDLHQAGVYDLADWRETFDLVLFMGVFYHLRYPLLGLEAAARRARELLVFQSLSVPEEEVVHQIDGLDDLEALHRLTERGWPRLSFVEHEAVGDPTNRWLPNRAAMEALLRDVGFSVIARPVPGMYVARRRPGWRPSPDREAEFRAACGRGGRS